MKYLLPFLLLLPFYNLAQTSPAIDSLENVIKSQPHDTVKVLTHSELCWEYRIIDQQKALLNGHTAVEIAREIDYAYGLGRALNDLSIIYIDKGSLDTASTLLEEAKEIRQELKDDAGVAAIHNKLGIIYEHLVQLENAMLNHMAALEYYESIDNKPNVGFCLNNIGNVHFKMKNYIKAEEVHSRALDIRTEIGDQYGVAGSHSNLANLKMFTGDTSAAIYHFNEAIKVYRENQYDNDLAVTLNNLGTLYVGRDLDMAEKYVTEAYDIRVRLNDARGICSSSIIMGEIYAEKGNFKKAQKYLHTGLSLSKQSGFQNKEKGAYEKLAKLYTYMGIADSVHYYYSAFFAIEKAQYEANLNEQVNELQTIYETEKKDKENEMLAREKAEEEVKRQEADLKVSNRNTIIIIITALIFVVLLAFLLILQRNKKIAAQEKTSAVLREKEQGLKAVFDATEEERQRISKDLHDSVGQQLSGLKMAWGKLASSEELDKQNKERIEQLSEILSESVEEIRDISHQMMPKVLIEFGLVEAITEMLSKALKYSDINYEFESFNLDERYDQRIEIGLYRICQELINNVIKHSQASFVSVQLFKNKNQLILIVEDNGQGMKKETSDGHGMMNIQSRLNTINGEVNYQAGNEAGTMATVRVKIENTLS